MGPTTSKGSVSSQTSNAESTHGSQAPSESAKPENNDWSEERRQNKRRAYPVNVNVAPYDAIKAPTEMAFLRARCHDVSADGLSLFLPAPPTFQYMVVAQGTPPHHTYVMAEVIHFRPDPDSSGEYLVGCRLIGEVPIAVIEDGDGLNLLAFVPAFEAGHKALEERPAERSAPLNAAGALPRTITPETRAEIEKMREIAVESARKNIRRHFQRQMLLTMGDNLLITAVGLLAGAALVWVWKSSDSIGLIGYIALAGFPVAILWGTRVIVMAKHFIAGDKLR